MLLQTQENQSTPYIKLIITEFLCSTSHMLQVKNMEERTEDTFRYEVFFSSDATLHFSKMSSSGN